MTQRHQVVIGVAATLAPGYDVMHVCRRHDTTIALALCAQRVRTQEHQTPALPPAIIAALRSRAALVIVLALGLPPR